MEMNLSRIRAIEVRRFARYASVSAISTVTTLSVLGVLVGVIEFPPTWSNVIAVGVGTVPSFVLNRRWVWRYNGPRSPWRQALPYCALSLAGLFLSTLSVHLAAEATLGSPRLVHTGAVEVANFASYGALWLVQFVLCDRVLFNKPRSAARDEECHEVANAA